MKDTSHLVLVITILPAPACSASDDSTDSGPTPELVDPESDTAPTPAATTADITFRAVPSGYADCGATNLTSGWPTTAPYPPHSAQCITDAAQSGARSQYAYYGRDNTGGINGTIIRVNGVNDITMIGYQVGSDGDVDSTETSCASLLVPSMTPPVCDP